MVRIRKKHSKNFGKRIKSSDGKKVKIIGTLTINLRKGFGFIRPEKSSPVSCDIFVPARNLKGAIDGDIVEVLVMVPENPESPLRLKGSILKVIQSARKQMVGTIIELQSPLRASCYIPLLNLSKNYSVDLQEGRTYLPGDRILIHSPEWTENPPKNRSFIMKSFIGNIDDPKCDFTVIKEEFSLKEIFPESVKAETLNISEDQINPANRKDLRKLVCFTIDSASAKDFDDAVSLEIDAYDNYLLGVHIADVSHYVHPGMAIDEEARSRGNSTYFPDKVLPMLPPKLCDNLCSLKPGVDRLAVSVFMTLNSKGELIKYDFFKSVINSKYRLTYDEVDAIIEKKIKHPAEKIILLMFSLSQKLRQIREERGCIRFTLPSFSLNFNKDKDVIGLTPNHQTDSHRLIEEFMLKANEIVASHLNKKGVLIPFRIHEEPEPASLSNFHQFVSSLGFKLTLTHTQEFDYQMLLHSMDDHPLGPFIHSHFVRSMKTASYSTANRGHYGLKLNDYTHFTSPIRRYSDLIVHRLLFNDKAISEEDLEDIVQICSSKERVSAKSEFAFNKIKKLRFLKTLKSTNDNQTYKVLIFQLKPDGLTFILPELFHEDFIPVEALPGTLRKLASEQPDSPQKISLIGQPLEVFIKEIDLITQQIKWGVKNSESNTSANPENGKTKQKRFSKSKKKYRRSPSLQEPSEHKKK